MDVSGKLTAETHLTGQHFGISRNEQHIIKRQALLNDSFANQRHICRIYIFKLFIIIRGHSRSNA